MATFKTTLTVLREQANRIPSSVFFKIPQYDGERQSWKDVSYATCLADVERSAQAWTRKLQGTVTEARAVVGVWLKGVSYDDYIHTLGLIRAGYIPQLISLRMTDPSVVYELLEKAKAVALIHDASFTSMLHNSPVPTFPGGTLPSEPLEGQATLSPICEASDPEHLIMILHTSGSTSGIPKLVPITARWVDSLLNKMKYSRDYAFTPDPEILIAIGSYMHMGSHMCIWASLVLGGTMVLPTTIPYSSHELSRIIKECGLNRLMAFPPLLSSMFREADKDPDFLALLQGLASIGYGGMALEPMDLSWARERGMQPVNFFGSTEMGYAMAGRQSANDSYLEAFPGSTFEFQPLDDGSGSDSKLLELVIPPESPDCPHQSLRGPDGKFHSGDLFTEITPGRYLSQGRADGWIKMETSLRCDTSAIEANVIDTCGKDLVHAVAVVGDRRPSPMLVVEPHEQTVPNGVNGNTPHTYEEQLKKDILERIMPFHQRRYQHERIQDHRFIMVVPKGSLPRTATKGNIRRKEVEKTLKDQIDVVYNKA